MRAGAGTQPADAAPGRARLPERLPQVHLARSAAGQAGQRRQGHRLEHREGSEAGRRPQPSRGRERRQPGPAAYRQRHRRRRGGPRPGSGNQRPGRGQGLGSAVEDHRPRARPPGAAQGRREDPLPRHPGAAAQDHLQPDLVRPRGRARQLQRRLHQRPRADPVAHHHRSPAVLPGSPVDAGVRRRLRQLLYRRSTPGPPRNC